MASEKPTYQQAIKNIEKWIQKLPEEITKIVIAQALVTKSRIQKRIQEKGISYSGAQLAPYSKGYTSFKKAVKRYKGHTDFTLGQWSVSALQSQRDKTKKEKKKKALDSLYSAYKNSSRASDSVYLRRKLEIEERYNSKPIKQKPSNHTQLWSSVKTFEPIKQNEGQGAVKVMVRVSVAADDQLNQIKAQAIEKKWGNFLRMSKSEERDAYRDIKQEIQKIIDKIKTK
jgi:hypothetical protein